MVSLAVFDFDGTLADTMDAYIQICNDLLEEFGHARLSDAQIQQVRNEGPRAALKEIKFPMWKLPTMIKRTRKALREQYPSVETFPGVSDQLQKLRDNKVSMGILTSNSPENIEPFLTKHKFHKYFEFIYSKSSLYGKARHLKKIAKTQKVDFRHIVLIGDEVRDIEAANKVGAKSIAVTWGANTRQALKTAQPDAVVTEVDQIAGTVLQLLAN